MGWLFFKKAHQGLSACGEPLSGANPNKGRLPFRFMKVFTGVWGVAFFQKSTLRSFGARRTAIGREPEQKGAIFSFVKVFESIGNWLKNFWQRIPALPRIHILFYVNLHLDKLCEMWYNFYHILSINYDAPNHSSAGRRFSRQQRTGFCIEWDSVFCRYRGNHL